MKRLLVVPILMILLLVDAKANGAPSFQVVSDRFLWISSNLVETHFQGPSFGTWNNQEPSSPLGLLSFQNHIQHFGTPPPLDFLMPLQQGPSPFAEIKKGHILFRKTGQGIPLDPGSIPAGAIAAQPYLLSLPQVKYVAVVYPYYQLQNKAGQFVTQVYSEEGALLSTYDGLPTHISSDDPMVLVSCERSGYFQSYRWVVRFYNLRQNRVYTYSCPEGCSGDLLFAKLANGRTFVIAQEIVGKVSEIGISLQTNLFLVDSGGAPLASGKALFAMREPGLHKRKAESLFPFCLSNLFSIDHVPDERHGFMLHFGPREKRTVLKLISTFQGTTPCVVFAQPKAPSRIRGAPDLRIGDASVGSLPLLLVLAPGKYSFSSSSATTGKNPTRTWNIEPDQVNIVTVE